MSKLIRIIKVWLPIAFVVTVLSGVIYWVMQQNYRQSVYDPQIEIAEDSALAMQTSPFRLGPSMFIDISKSLATFKIFYGADRKIIESDAVLNGQSPTLPNGVFDWAQSHGEDRFTWQPQDNIRIATVVVSFNSSKSSGYVVVGRNLREVERRIEKLGLQILIGWGISMMGSLTLVFILETTSHHRS